MEGLMPTRTKVRKKTKKRTPRGKSTKIRKKITLEDIFASKTQVKLIKFFLDNPRKEYYQTELCVRLKESLGSIQYELARLVRMNFLNIRRTKVRTYYSTNNEFSLYQEFLKIVKKVR